MVVGNRSHFLRMAALVALVVATLASCGGGTAARSDGPLVVVSTSVLGDVVAELVGDQATVEVLMTAGADPHDYEPSARTAARLREAEVVVTNGLGLEVGLASTLEAARNDGVVVVEVGEFVSALPFADDHPADDHPADDHPADDHGDHSHDSLDPHFWHDPNRVIEALPGLVDALTEAMPELDPERIEGRAAALADRLEALDAEIEAILTVVPDSRRLLLTNHHTLGYFADRYDFEIVGTVIPGGDTMASPSAADLAALVDLIEAHQLPAIFAEVAASSAIADTLAAEVGFEVVVVELFADSLGPADSEAATYPDMLRTNARRVAEALG